MTGTVLRSGAYTPSSFSLHRDEISRRVAERLLKEVNLPPEIGEAIVLGKYRDEIATHLLYLAEAVAATSPALFRHYTEWATNVLQSTAVSSDQLRAGFVGIADVLRETASYGDTSIAIDYLEDALPLIDKSETVQPSSLASANELAPQLLNLLLACDRENAIGLIDAAVDSGMPVLEIYLQVFQPVLREVGTLWQHNQISVAQEHYCSAAVSLMMGRLADKIFSADRIGKTVLSACVGDELHEIGLRMVADAMEMSGWDTHFLGANVPAADLTGLARRLRADVIALSVTLTSNLSQLNEIIRQLRNEVALQDAKIVVGGSLFAIQPDLWRKVGADGCARDAGHAIEVCAELAGI